MRFDPPNRFGDCSAYPYLGETSFFKHRSSFICETDVSLVMMRRVRKCAQYECNIK